MKRKSAEINVVKPLALRNPDTKYLGNEPTWSQMPVPEARLMAQTRAFAWYNYFCDNKEAKQFTISWMSRTGFPSTDCRRVAQCPDRAFVTTPGWLARMTEVGWVLNDREKQYMADRIQQYLTQTPVDPADDVAIEPKKSEVPKVTIQDRLREKIKEAGGEIEGMFDDMLAAGGRSIVGFKPIDVLRTFNVAPQMVSDISEHWRRVSDELNQATKGKDPDLVEGYSHRNKIQLRNMLKFAEQVVADCASYVQVKKVERKPRKKKPVSPEKLTVRFKFLREFTELGLKSVPVTQLVDAQEAWLYDSKQRKLIYVVHEDLSGSFTVKGSALIGFDPNKSVRKTLRKPKEQIKAIMSAGAPAARKLFKDIRSTETKFNGRGNEHMVLLKVR